MLATNFLGISGHPLILEAERLIASIKVTPAEVGEQLLKSDDQELALQGLIKFLEHKKETERVREGNLEMTKREVTNVEKMEEGSKNLKTCKTSDGLKELIKIAKASSADKMEKILEKDDDANALKILMDFLAEEIGTKNVEDSDPSLVASVAPLSESGKEEGIEIE
ncbi:UNVERIFIED_CONTAM: AAA-ATPase [Sesamum latifolium]|uniref:AAA-ATPase n=1 Tax=Sesamum latifolium TaxID=2727402 RepID=A0AAW2UZ36_9LAMI